MTDTYTKQQAKALRTRVSGIARKGAQSIIDVCWACQETYDAQVNIDTDLIPVWQLWGYKSWQQCVGIELGLHQTTAHAYRKVWCTFYVDLAGAWSVEHQLPITKMRILCAAKLTKNNVQSWLIRAAKLTCPQLIAEVYGTDELHNLSVPISLQGLEAINKAIVEARDEFGQKGLTRGEILLRIVREWRSVNQKVERNPRGKLRLVG